MDLLLSLTAGLMHLAAFGIYNRQMLRGESRPNPATWSLWSFISILNALTYFSMNGDMVKAVLPVMSTAACIGTFLLAMATGKLSKLSRSNAVILGIGLISTAVWWLFRSAAAANMLLQVAVAISFAPTISGVRRDAKTERALPWFIWSGAYFFLIATVALRWRGHGPDLVYPCAGLALHAIVGLLALRR